jgi:hypothetical protein
LSARKEPVGQCLFVGVDLEPDENRRPLFEERLAMGQQYESAVEWERANPSD